MIHCFYLLFIQNCCIVFRITHFNPREYNGTFCGSGVVPWPCCGPHTPTWFCHCAQTCFYSNTVLTLRIGTLLIQQQPRHPPALPASVAVFGGSAPCDRGRCAAPCPMVATTSMHVSLGSRRPVSRSMLHLASGICSYSRHGNS